jgi:hypothetical protein
MSSWRRIEELAPTWRMGVLVINCPCGQCGGRVRIRTQIAMAAAQPGEKTWMVSGQFPDLTLKPSVDAGCWHGWITAGGVTTI